MVGRTTIGDYKVSTVFLVYDHGFGDKPLLFETMIMHSEQGFLDDIIWRYSTWDEALAGHRDAVNYVIKDLLVEDERYEKPKEYEIYLVQEKAIRKIRVEGNKSDD